MMFATEHPYVPLRVTSSDLQLASVTLGWTIGFTYFVVCHAVRETRRAGRINAYIILIWTEILASMVFAVICWLYLRTTIAPSFAFFFIILTCWALQVQILLQIIVNRICVLLPDEATRNRLRFGVAGVILLVNISVYCIWIPAKLQISDGYVSTNVWWDRCEKCIYLIVDALLNFYFIYTVRARLVSHGLKKYDALVRYNIQIISVSLAMDVLIIGMMSLPNPFVYMQFHPVAYIVKLNIEMSMGQLIIKVATGTGLTVYDEGSGRKQDSDKSVMGMEVLVNRQVFTSQEPVQLQRNTPKSADMDDGSISVNDVKADVV